MQPSAGPAALLALVVGRCGSTRWVVTETGLWEKQNAAPPGWAVKRHRACWEQTEERLREGAGKAAAVRLTSLLSKSVIKICVSEWSATCWSSHVASPTKQRRGEGKSGRTCGRWSLGSATCSRLGNPPVATSTLLARGCFPVPAGHEQMASPCAWQLWPTPRTCQEPAGSEAGSGPWAGSPSSWPRAEGALGCGGAVPGAALVRILSSSEVSLTPGLQLIRIVQAERNSWGSRTDPVDKEEKSRQNEPSNDFLKSVLWLWVLLIGVVYIAYAVYSSPQNLQSRGGGVILLCFLAHTSAEGVSFWDNSDVWSKTVQLVIFLSLCMKT